MLEKLQGKGLLIHHWDTDGLCSATLLLRHLSNRQIDNKTPILGNYFLEQDELSCYSKYDFVIVADLALPKEDIHVLAENTPVLIFDHHLSEEIKRVFHHNPVIKGENPDEYPSASWIINNYLGYDVNLLALLGVIGDYEQRIKHNPSIYQILTDFLQKNKLDFNDMLKMVYLLDSSYKIGNKEQVEETPHMLLTIDSAEDILSNRQWNENLTKLEGEIAKQLEKPTDETKNIVLKEINTPYNIISTVTRRIAWNTSKDTLVINTGFFKNKDQIYVRSNKVNLQPLIVRGKTLGFRCGGKKEVFGAIVPKDQTCSFVKEITEFLDKQGAKGV
jgi:single-stranded DNA-specific DHH superfamily exonuclease